jgi:ethanolamine utilization protein EutN
VHGAKRRTDVRACAETKPLVVDEELGLSFEHIERVDVVVVGVRVGPFEAGLELKLDQGELISADLDRRDSVFAHEPFAFAGREEDCLRSGSATTRGSIDAVEAAGLAAIALLQIPSEATVRRVEVQEPRTRRAPESVDDLRRSADARSRRQQLLVIVDEHRKPTGDLQAAIDTVQAGDGDLVYLVGSREAALALEPWFVPVDAAIVGIVDGVDAPRSEDRR